MNEDRDLDAIRDSDVYRALVKRIEKSFELPPEDQVGSGDVGVTLVVTPEGSAAHLASRCVGAPGGRPRSPGVVRKS